jgi:hypothetical protein
MAPFGKVFSKRDLRWKIRKIYNHTTQIRIKSPKRLISQNILSLKNKIVHLKVMMKNLRKMTRNKKRINKFSQVRVKKRSQWIKKK